MSKIYHWFLPHQETHKKATLVSWEGLAIYVLLFLLLQVSFSLVNSFKPGVLGISGNIDQQKLIELTNEERQKNGLPALKENSALDVAAKLKAANMFKEDYWAHFAPSGKSPWDFILGVGYKFKFAGENLAKNFQTSDDVVNAWMASSSHRENIVNKNYQEIGVAVVEGTLNGQKTILVVQMFGSSSVVAANPQFNVNGKKLEVSERQLERSILPNPDIEVNNSLGANSNTPSVLIDPYQVSKVLALSILGLMSILLLVDFMILRRRGVFRMASHNLAHFALFSVVSLAILSSTPGNIL